MKRRSNDPNAGDIAMVPPRLIRRALYRLARVPEPADHAGVLRALCVVLDRIRQRRTLSRGMQ